MKQEHSSNWLQGMEKLGSTHKVESEPKKIKNGQFVMCKASSMLFASPFLEMGGSNLAAKFHSGNFDRERNSYGIPRNFPIFCEG